MDADIRPVGAVTDAHGRVLEIGQDHDAIYLRSGSAVFLLGGSVRDDVMRLMFAADELAVQWAERCAEASA